MNKSSEKLFMGFLELCEELVSEAWVVTDGRAVMTAVLDHEVAIKICQLAIRKTDSDKWKVAKLADSIEMAYRCGYEHALNDINNNDTGEEASEDGLAPETDGENDGEDSELRDGDIQHQEG